MNDETETQERRLGPRLLMLVLGVLLVVGLIYLQQDEEPGGSAEPAVPPVPPPAPLQEEAGPSPGAEARGDEARAIIARARGGETERDLDAIFAQAKTFQEQGRAADAYLLYFYGARAGDAAAALMLGRIYDPTGSQGLEPIVDEPIPAQAYKWYRAAADAGSEVALDYLANLRGWAEDAAAQGAPDARQLLMMWE